MVSIRAGGWWDAVEEETRRNRCEKSALEHNSAPRDPADRARSIRRLRSALRPRGVQVAMASGQSALRPRGAQVAMASGPQMKVAIRRWGPRLRQEYEFRAFVHAGALTAISQYNPYCFYPEQVADHDELLSTLERYWRERLADVLASSRTSTCRGEREARRGRSGRWRWLVGEWADNNGGRQMRHAALWKARTVPAVRARPSVFVELVTGSVPRTERQVRNRHRCAREAEFLHFALRLRSFSFWRLDLILAPYLPTAWS